MANDDQQFSDSPQREVYLQFMFSVIHGDREGALRCIDAQRFCAFVPGHFRVDFDEFFEIFTTLRTVAPNFGDEIEHRGSIEEPDVLCTWYRTAYIIENPDLRLVEYSAFSWVTFNNDGKILELRIMYNLNDLHQQSFGIPSFRRNLS